MAAGSLSFSWVLTNQLAIGPLPRSDSHWLQLEEAGFSSRFSCCYPEEEQGINLPEGWRSDRISLPDHREQEAMRTEALVLAITRAQALLQEAPPLYLHCMAGRERSPLLAVGLTARLRGIDLLEALAWVRRCHPMAMPIYPHLVMLDSLISEGFGTPGAGADKPMGGRVRGRGTVGRSPDIQP
ncbi:hypothetical protein [Synechococcus sp. CCY 9618]|uniref:protein-tyrosine phosphatase family protein n=1 Tax=Synechococcus sp. CCY 9618 TaxID=2815602 RepID=UPI001C2292E8|nr:hypothetical protein [Synechococcus sp. CCY 9618]